MAETNDRWLSVDEICKHLGGQKTPFTNGLISKTCLLNLYPEIKGGPKRADYVLYGKPNVPIAVVEAKEKMFKETIH